MSYSLPTPTDLQYWRKQPEGRSAMSSLHRDSSSDKPPASIVQLRRRRPEVGTKTASIHHHFRFKHDPRSRTPEALPGRVQRPS